MRVLFKVVLTLAILLAAAAGAGYSYIQPKQALTLDYQPVSLTSKAAEMLKARSLTFTLSRSDVDNLLKEAIAKQPEISPDWLITGAEFHLLGDRLQGDLNLQWRGWLNVRTHVDYRLQWQAPDLAAEPLDAGIGAWQAPAGWVQLPSYRLNVAQYLPNMVTVQTVSFPGSDIRVQLKLDMKAAWPPSS